MNVTCTGTFLAHFIAIIGPYSQLKIVSFFPNHQGKKPVENYKIEEMNKKI